VFVILYSLFKRGFADIKPQATAPVRF